MLVRVAMDGLDFCLLLIGAERSVVIHGGDLRLGVFVNFLHLRFLIIGQVEIRTSPPGTLCRSGLGLDRKSTRLNSSHRSLSRMPSSA